MAVRAGLAELGGDSAQLLQRLLQVEEAGGRFEETHTKRGYWVENDLLASLDHLAERSNLSGSRIVNRALAFYLAALGHQAGPSRRTGRSGRPRS